MNFIFYYIVFYIYNNYRKKLFENTGLNQSEEISDDE